MGNYTSKLLAVFKQLKEIAEENDKNILEVKNDFDTIFTDKFTLQIAKEYNKIGIATEVYRKYGISEKYFRKLISKVQEVKPKPQRKIKEFIYSTLEEHNVTYEEYKVIARYFDKHKLDTDKALNKLLQLRELNKKNSNKE